jgi:opacity protein-like surface antigen
LFSQPFIKVGLGGNIVIPTADFGGTPNDFGDGTRYGVHAGAGFHLVSRFSFAGLPLRTSINYAILKSSGAAAVGTLEQTQKIFSLSIQPEYFFSTDRSASRAYVGGIIELNNFGGDVTFSGAPGIPDGLYVISSAERIGFGAAAGLLIPLNERITMDLALSFHAMNPFGKRYEEAVAQPQRLNAFLWLNDAADPQYAASDPNHFIGAPRKIRTLQLTVSFLFAYSQL